MAGMGNLSCNMIPKSYKVPYAFLEECGEKNSCGSLDDENLAKSSGELIDWKHRHWVCVSSVSSGARGYHEVTLVLVVPECKYDGPAYKPNHEAKPGLRYRGVRLTSKKQIWVLTGTEITLFPISERSTYVPPVS
jgi:hypothetical protein